MADMSRKTASGKPQGQGPSREEVYGKRKWKLEAEPEPKPAAEPEPAVEQRPFYVRLNLNEAKAFLPPELDAKLESMLAANSKLGIFPSDFKFDSIKDAKAFAKEFGQYFGASMAKQPRDIYGRELRGSHEYADREKLIAALDDRRL